MTPTLEEMATDPREFRRGLYIPGALGIGRCLDLMAPFQEADFAALDQAMIAIRDGAVPSPNRFWIERTKGASKSSDCAVELLWVTFATSRMLTIQCAASDAEQADEVRKAMKTILSLDENAWLRAIITVQEGRVVNTRTGTTIDILTADSKGAHGSRPDVLLIDEASHVSKWEFIETLADNAAKNPRGVLIVGTNAGQTDSPAFKYREMARQSARWYFSSFTDVAPWISQEELAERRSVVTPSRFARLWQGQWVSGGDVIDPADLERSMTLSGPARFATDNRWCVAALDIGIKNDRSALTVVELDFDSHQVNLLSSQTWAPLVPGAQVNLDEVEQAVREAFGRYAVFCCLADPWQAAQMIQRLQGSGLDVREYPFTAASLDQMAHTLISAFRNGQLKLFRDDRLIADLCKLSVVERAGGRYKLVAIRDSTGHADAAVSLAMTLPLAFDLLRTGIITGDDDGGYDYAEP